MHDPDSRDLPEPRTQPGLRLPGARGHEPPTAHDDIDDLERATVRFLGSVDADLLAHPLVQGAGRCERCGAVAPAAAASWRRRRIVELIIAVETETLSRLTHGLVLELTLPPYVICGHVPVLPLPAWEGGGGTVYYARRPRVWEGEDAPTKPEERASPEGATPEGASPERAQHAATWLGEPTERRPPPATSIRDAQRAAVGPAEKTAPTLDPPVVVFSRAPLDELALDERPDPTTLAEALAFLDEPVTVVGRSPVHHPEARRDAVALPRPDLVAAGAAR